MTRSLRGAPHPSAAAASGRSVAALLLAGATATACAAPSSAPLAPADVARSLDERAPDPAALAPALASARVAPLAVPVPALPAPGAEATDLDAAAPWHASAFAWEAGTRAARRALLAARAAARAAGAPQPIGATVEVEQAGDLDERGRLMITFDLLGILGLGPAAAARELADAGVRRALGALEEAVWSGRVEVDRARARLAAARAELALLRGLEADVEATRPRIEILGANGRLSERALAAAAAAEERLRLRVRLIEAEEAEARRGLAVAAGLAHDSAALDALTPRTLAEIESALTPEVPPRLELLRRSPELRVAVLDLAVADARVREAAARRWPSLAVGPHLAWMQGDLLEGVLAGTSLPWPGSLGGLVDAAVEEREAAREAVADALLAVEARALAARERHLAARAAHLDHAAPLASESERGWRAARASFAVDPAALEAWSGALGARVEATGELVRTRLAAIEAALDVELAAGPPLPERSGDRDENDEPRLAAREVPR